MPPAMLGPVKAMARSLEVAALRGYLETLIDGPDHSLREKLRAFSRDHGVVIEN
jgi:phosphotransferase system enzyme I (PtsP)